jgi:hypothetical protein
MKATFKVLGVTFLLAIVFAAGYGTAVHRGWGNRTVDAEVVNQSGQILKSFTLRYTTCGANAEITGGPLFVNERRSVRFNVCGEGGYVVEATLADGRVVRGTEGYVQSGNSTIDVVTQNGVDSNLVSAYAL